MRGGALVLVLAITQTGALPSYAAELTGRVVDVTGGTIHNTTVELRGESGPAVITSFVTGYSGDFQFADLPPDTYKVSFTAAGFRVSHLTRTLTEGQRVSLGDVVLQVAAVENCPDIWDRPAVREEAQNSGAEVTGSVEERWGRPLPRVVVALESTTHTYRTATDPTGIFRLGPIEPGVYTLHVVQPGFAEFIVDGLKVLDRRRTAIADPLQVSRCPENVKCKPIREVLKAQICL